MLVDTSAVGLRGKFKYESNWVRTINYHRDPINNDSLLLHSPNGEVGICNVILPVPQNAYWLVLR